MGFRAVDWAIEQRVKAGPKLTLICIASFANDEGLAWPSEEELATMISDADEQDETKHRVACLRTVTRHVKYLEDHGLLTITKRRTPKGYLRNEYQLLAPPGRFSYRKPHAKLAHGPDEATRQFGARPHANLAHGHTPNWRINQSYVNQSLVNPSPADAGEDVPARPLPASASLRQAAVRAARAIAGRWPAMSGSEQTKLAEQLAPIVRGHADTFEMSLDDAADDVAAWHAACCAAHNGDFMPLTFYSKGVQKWVRAGRPDVEPNPFTRDPEKPKRARSDSDSSSWANYQRATPP